MVDVWRLRNPRAKEGTHTSSAHASWSRTDYWLMSAQLSTWTRGVQHLAKTSSDHSPVKLDLVIPTKKPVQYLRRFNANALLNPTY